MHKGGWKPFWAALGAALLVLLPLVGGTVLLTRQMLRQQWLMQTAEPQRGVPIDLPKADDRMTLLLCTAGEQPGFVLFYLNAPQNAAHLLAVPGQLTVPFGGGEASLAQCYAAAGPARCRQALLETLALPEDTLYLALSPAVLETLAARYGAVRVSLSGALTAEELDALGQSPSVQTFRAREALDLLTGLEPIAGVADAGDGDALNGQHGHHTAANVQKGAEGREMGHPAGEHRAGKQRLQEEIQGPLLDLPAAEQSHRSPFSVGGD